MLYNHERVDYEKFGDDKLIQESKIVNMQFNPRNPSWTEYTIQPKELEDETNVLQFGQVETVEYA